MVVGEQAGVGPGEAGKPDAVALSAAYAIEALRTDPITATSLGLHDYDDSLGETSGDAMREAAQRRAAALAECEAAPAAPVGTTAWLDRETLLMELRTAVRTDEVARVWERAPYWWAERLGGALSPMILRDYAPLEERGAMLLRRLQGVPGYFRDAEANLTTDSPRAWAEMGVTAARGLTAFLAGGVVDFAGSLPAGLGREAGRAARDAVAAAEAFGAFVEELVPRARGEWAAGAEHVDFLFREFHRVDFDHESLAAFGAERVASDTQALEEFAAALDPDAPWQEQLARIKDRHPQPDEFLRTYGDEMVRAREHTLAQSLVTIPEGETCTMGWVPTYLVASLPIAVMATAPPFEAGLESDWLITPSDPAASPQRRLEQMRDNCYVFAESIAGHETYPGHHLQKVHHKLATVDSPIRRLFSSPSFVEGWGLYVEDLQGETGFFDNDPVRLFQLRNALWRSIRVVVDTGLHTRGLGVDEAVAVLRDQAGIDTHMATGEVRRYIRHDNPTYPSSYLVGKEAIHQLRAEWTARGGGVTNHQAFHDALLSYGSVPVSLVARMLESRDKRPNGTPEGDHVV